MAPAVRVTPPPAPTPECCGRDCRWRPPHNSRAVHGRCRRGWENDGHARAEHDAGGIGIGEERQFLGQHVARLHVRHQQDVGITGDRRNDALRQRGFAADGVVECERAVEDAALDLSALGHFAERRGIDGGRDLRCHRLHRAEDRDLRPLDAERLRQFDGVGDDVRLLVQRRPDVDRGVGDEQQLGIGRHVHDEDVADAADGANAGGAADDGAP